MNNVIIVKRDGTQVPYDRNKIICAINKALLEVDGNIYSGYISENVATSIESYFDYHTVECITVEEIQDLVEWNLINGPSQNWQRLIFVIVISARWPDKITRN